jgi:hypothetical protein
MQDTRHHSREPDPGLTPVQVPVFPELARTFGYPGECRFVAFHWSPGGDEVAYDDGVRSGTGASHAFLAYWRHPAVAPQLRSYHLGSSDEGALYCLVFDQDDGRAFVTARAQAREFLCEQHPEQEGATYEEIDDMSAFYEVEELSDLAGELLAGFEEVQVSPQELARAMQEEHDAITSMVAKLDQWQADREAT